MSKKIISFTLCCIFLLSCFSLYPIAKAQSTTTTIPDIYIPYIRELQQQHPNWNFEFFETGLNWDTVIENESAFTGNSARNLISGRAFPKSYRSVESGAYNEVSDAYKAMDGSTWYKASKEVVEYYMDPRNFLTESDIFQFEKLSYDKNTQNIEGVKSILKSSFMDNKYISNGNSTISYADAFMEAAAISGVSPYHLASKAIQEVGRRGSDSVSGTVPEYKGIYNYYNIGASAGRNPVLNGLKWASNTTAKTYRRPWTTPYKSIVGGAEYIGKNYINKGQNSIYLEKFDVESTHSGMYWHQYMQNVSGACSEGKSVYNAYASLGILDTNFTFTIPVYKNMPAEKSQLPITAGSPRCWLDSLSIHGYNITPNNTMQVKTNDFYAVVPNEIESVTVSAVPHHSAATISGIQMSAETTSFGVVNVSSYLKVRTSPELSRPDNKNRLIINGSYVNLTQGMTVKILEKQNVAGTDWLKVSFSHRGSEQIGWVCGKYIEEKHSIISSNGTLNLLVGENVFKFIVSGEGDNERTYILHITREKSQDNPSQNILIKTNYALDQDNFIISNIPVKTNVNTFKDNVFIDNHTSVYIEHKTPKSSDEFIGTGDILSVYSGNAANKYILSVSGDITGDGVANIFDIIKVRNHIIKKVPLVNVYYTSADINHNGNIEIFDLIKIRNESIK